MDTSKLIATIVDASAAKGINQKALARAALVSEESLSRLKKSGNPTMAVVERLANIAGLHFALLPDDTAPKRATAPARHRFQTPSSPKAFRDAHRTLVWSNPNADDTTYIRKALLQPRFTVLLDAALSFGVPRLKAEWETLLADGSPEVRRATPVTQRVLRNIQHGYEQASA